MRNGGYSIIDLSVTDNLYTNVVKAVNTEKPVLVYGDDVPYFADSVTVDSDAVTITKGGQIISISNVNVITKTGDKDGALLSSIVDDDGNARFVEGTGTVAEVDGVTISYNKWSLSGTHLMLVVTGTIADETVISSNTKIIDFAIPQWVLNKIFALVGSDIDRKNFTLYASDYTTQTSSATLIKRESAGTVAINISSAYTATAERIFRIQFDLLIDSE